MVKEKQICPNCGQIIRESSKPGGPERSKDKPLPRSDEIYEHPVDPGQALEDALSIRSPI